MLLGSSHHSRILKIFESEPRNLAMNAPVLCQPTQTTKEGLMVREAPANGEVATCEKFGGLVLVCLQPRRTTPPQHFHTSFFCNKVCNQFTLGGGGGPGYNNKI